MDNTGGSQHRGGPRETFLLGHELALRSPGGREAVWWETVWTTRYIMILAWRGKDMDEYEQKLSVHRPQIQSR